MFSSPVGLNAPSRAHIADYSLAYFSRNDVDHMLSSIGTLFDFFHSDELAEFDRLADKKRADRIQGRLAAKRAIIDYCARVHDWSPRPNTFTVENDEWGKPLIRFIDRDSPQPPRLSISHCPWGAAAVAGPSPVGIDIEVIIPRPRSVIEFIATPEEAAITKTAEDQARLWTGKEAVLKLLGLGLDADARNIRIIDGRPLLSGEPANQWRALRMPQLAVHFQNLGGAMMAIAYARGING